ncbi:MAG: hypothetical protein AB1817_12010, partial [Chloroflexota bacterium]
YNAERLPVEIILFSGAPMQMQFNVYTPDQIGADFSVGNPIGRGLPPSGSDNLQWKGVFYGGGTYYVELINPTSTAKTFLLGIAGGGVTLRIQPPAPTPIPTRIPPPPPSPTINLMQSVMIPAIAALRAQVGSSAAVTTTVTTTQPVAPTITPTPQTVVIVIVPATPVPPPTVPAPTPVPAPPPVVNDWFTNAIYVVSGRTQTIPGNSERWFVFDYTGDRSKVEIRIPGGNEKKLQFRLFTMDQILRYTVDGTPIGVGTAPIVACDAGRCVSNDLVWAGDFMMNGTYFIQVTNFDPTPKNYEIVVTGGGVTLGR